VRRDFASALLLALALPAAVGGQSLRIGTQALPPFDTEGGPPTVATYVNVVDPASATGTVDSATFVWSAACIDGVKIKFFRRRSETLVFLEERGPFSTTGVAQTVALSPPVAVQEGDLIGIARIAECGGPTVGTTTRFAGFIAYPGDVTSPVPLSFGVFALLNLSATGTATESLLSVIPVAGSTPGASGSFFRTGVQLFNPGTLTVSGRFVYHPAIAQGSTSDPSLTFTIAPGATISYDDLVQTMGRSGVGSIDVIQPSGQPFAPVIAARVFNDAGAAGTSGFGEDDVRSDTRILSNGASGFLLAPEPVKFRFNLGVRTFFSGATILFGQRDASGAIVRTASKTYPPTYFEQRPAADVLGGPIGANDSIEVFVAEGDAVVYGATVDNTNNDPSVQFARLVYTAAAF
jgi:hypothetical protein